MKSRFFRPRKHPELKPGPKILTPEILAAQKLLKQHARKGRELKTLLKIAEDLAAMNVRPQDFPAFSDQTGETIVVRYVRKRK